MMDPRDGLPPAMVAASRCSCCCCRVLGRRTDIFDSIESFFNSEIPNSARAPAKNPGRVDFLHQRSDDDGDASRPQKKVSCIQRVISHTCERKEGKEKRKGFHPNIPPLEHCCCHKNKSTESSCNGRRQPTVAVVFFSTQPTSTQYDHVSFYHHQPFLCC